MSDEAIEFEAFLAGEYFDGWLDGFLLAPALGRRLGGRGVGADFVCGPARPDWWNGDRVLITEPVPDGTISRLRERYGPIEMPPGRREVQLNTWDLPLPDDLAAARARVAVDIHQDDADSWTPTCRGVAVIELNLDGRTLRLHEVRV